MIFKAIDENGQLIHACDAIPGKEYICADCGVRMHVVRKDTTFFALYPGEEHKANRCMRLSQQKRSHTMANFNEDRFYERILAPEGQNDRHDNVRDRHNANQNDGNNHNHETSPTFTSLRQMWDEGLTVLPGNRRLGNRALSSVLVSNVSAHVWLNQSINGPRIIQCRPDGFSENDLKIFFKCLKKNVQQNGWDLKKVVLSFDNRDRFNDVVRHLFVERVKENGGIEWQPRVKWVLLAAEWEDFHKPACYRHCSTRRWNQNKCTLCHGRLEGNYVNHNQLYVPLDPSNLLNQ